MRSHPLLDAAASRGVKLGLDHVGRLLARLGDPHLGRPTVHVAGTNGKGSTCTMVTAALVEAGVSVGTFLSPHLVEVNERIRVDGAPIDDDALDASLRAVMAVCGDDPPTYFELTMGAAFVAFARAGVMSQVIEVGIGGRLDATNLVRPTVCAVTSIGLDHVEVLGPDIASIASEKAGIIKAGAQVVLGLLPPEAVAVVRARAAAVGVTAWGVGAEIGVHDTSDGLRITTPGGEVAGVHLAASGAHQWSNAGVAIGLLHGLRAAGVSVPDVAIRRGVGRAQLEGRAMWLAADVVVDGAHNVDGAQALAAWLATRVSDGRRTLVFGCGADRDPVALLAPLRPHVDRMIAVHGSHPRARRSADITALCGGDVVDGGPVREALDRARGDGLVVVAGSLYLIGDLLASWGKADDS